MEASTPRHFLTPPWRVSLIQALETPVLAHAVGVWSPLPQEVAQDPEITPEVHRDLIALVLVAVSLQLPAIAAQFPALFENVPSIAPLLRPGHRTTADTRLIADSKVFHTAFQRMVDTEKLLAKHQAAVAENEARRAKGLPLVPLLAPTPWRPNLAESLTILGEIFSDYEMLLKRRTQTIQRSALLTPLLAAQLLANFLGKTIWAKAERMLPEFGNRYPVWIRGKVVRVSTRGILLEPDDAEDAATLERVTTDGATPTSVHGTTGWRGHSGTTRLLAPVGIRPAVCEFLHGIDTFPALPPSVEVAAVAGTQAPL